MIMNEKTTSALFPRSHVFPERIILTGFRATGKSVVGRRLAGRIDRRFIDTDNELCGQMKCSIAEFVRQRGWPAFRELERELLVDLAQIRNVVIATGGGAILHENEWTALRRNSLTVWLRADAVAIRRRLEQDKASAGQRPSLTGGDSIREIDELLLAREPLYKQGSDVVVDTVNRTPEALALQIEQLFDPCALK